MNSTVLVDNEHASISEAIELVVYNTAVYNTYPGMITVIRAVLKKARLPMNVNPLE